MVSFIDQHRDEYGVEPICAVLPIAPSVYYQHKSWERDPDCRSARARDDEFLRGKIREIWDANYQVYGVDKVWRELKRQGIERARCTVERLMRELGLRGAIRGRTYKTTVGSDSAEQPLDLVERQFRASRPNQLWVADITFVSTWVGFVFVAFVIDVFSRRIVGWRVSNSLKTDLALDALEQAIYERCPRDGEGLVHHSDRGVQYVSIRYTERLAEANIQPSVGSVGDSYDNALAESINGLYKTEVIWRKGPWRSLEQVELATLEWVSWFNCSRLLGPIGYVPPVEFEQAHYRNQESLGGCCGSNRVEIVPPGQSCEATFSGAEAMQ